MLSYAVRMLSEVETNIVSVERIKQYCKIEQVTEWFYFKFSFCFVSAAGGKINKRYTVNKITLHLALVLWYISLTYKKWLTH